MEKDDRVKRFLLEATWSSNNKNDEKKSEEERVGYHKVWILHTRCCDVSSERNESRQLIFDLALSHLYFFPIYLSRKINFSNLRCQEKETEKESSSPTEIIKCTDLYKIERQRVAKLVYALFVFPAALTPSGHVHQLFYLAPLSFVPSFSAFSRSLSLSTFLCAPFTKTPVFDSGQKEHTVERAQNCAFCESDTAKDVHSRRVSLC